MGSVPQVWKDASIVTIYKNGDRTDCGNKIGISLLSIAGKIFARILLNRLSINITPYVVPETQCGFRGNRSTVDIIFCLWHLQEKCIKQDQPLYMVFGDRRSVQLGRPGYGSHWRIMVAQRSSQLWSRLYIPEWWWLLVLEGKSRNWSVSQCRGVKQGCVLARTLLSISNVRQGF